MNSDDVVPQNSRTKPPGGKQAALSLFFAGLLPVIAFTVIEEKYGTVIGLIVGMVFGVGEIIYEIVRHRKVATMTWVGNGLLIGLGAVSLISSEGIWFKLQPALMEGFFAIALFVSCLMGRPLLVWMAEKQGQVFPPEICQKFFGITLRTGVFFTIHAGLATWAALKWSTSSWAILKGVGLTMSFIFYLACEVLLVRRFVQNNERPSDKIK